MKQLEIKTMIDSYQLCQWAQDKYGITNNEWHKKIWRGQNFCDHFMENGMATFSYVDNPITELQEHINAFLDDYPELNGTVNFYFDR